VPKAHFALESTLRGRSWALWLCSNGPLQQGKTGESARIQDIADSKDAGLTSTQIFRD
jgi:hypothetical protein